MQTRTEIEAVRAQVRQWRGQGQSVAFVPTMGNLHAGHLALVDLARGRCEHVVASVFVNPTQFGPGEDFERYPRTLEADHAALEAHGCELLFAPAAEAIYPHGVDATVRVQVPGLTQILEGAHRPGHFDGVTTVVSKLLMAVEPDVAVFGRKDYQQWRVVEYLCRDLGLPVEIIGAPIVRDPDGLALSSRNQYLSSSERTIAPHLQAALRRAKARVLRGWAFPDVEQDAVIDLSGVGFRVDYVAVRNAVDLAAPDAGQRKGLVVLAAARLGNTRLIDNLEID